MPPVAQERGNKMSMWGDNPEWFDEWAVEWLIGAGMDEEAAYSLSDPWEFINKHYPDQYLGLAKDAEVGFYESSPAGGREKGR